MTEQSKRATTAYRLISEDGTHSGTVYDAEQAARDRDFYGERYGCIVQVHRVELARDPRGT